MYEKGKTPFIMLENQYLLIYEEDKEGKQTLTHTYCYEEDKLRKVSRGSINISKKKEKKIAKLFTLEMMNKFVLLICYWMNLKLLNY